MKQKLEKITKQNEAEERRFIEEKRSFDQLCEQHQVFQRFSPSLCPLLASRSHLFSLYRSLSNKS